MSMLPMEDPMMVMYEEEEEKKCSTGCIIVIVLFSLIGIALLCWGGWYFFIREEDTTTTNNKPTNVVNNNTGQRDPTQGRWEYLETDGQWYNYGTASAAAIEECYQRHCVSLKSETVNISPVPGYDYTVQVNSKTEIKQCPKGSGNFRKVKRNPQVSGGQVYQLWKFQDGASSKYYSPAACRAINKQLAAGKKDFIMDTSGQVYASAPADHGQKIIFRVNFNTMKQASLGKSTKTRPIQKASPQ